MAQTKDKRTREAYKAVYTVSGIPCKGLYGNLSKKSPSAREGYSCIIIMQNDTVGLGSQDQFSLEIGKQQPMTIFSVILQGCQCSQARPWLRVILLTGCYYVCGSNNLSLTSEKGERRTYKHLSAVRTAFGPPPPPPPKKRVKRQNLTLNWWKF